MKDRENKHLQDRVRQLEAGAAKVRRGVVTGYSGGVLTVTIAGSAEYANVKWLASYSPTVSDDVVVLTWENDLIVLGKKAG